MQIECVVVGRDSLSPPELHQIRKEGEEKEIKRIEFEIIALN